MASDAVTPHPGFMTLVREELVLTPSQRAAALRVNALMARAPRLKIAGWRLALGMRLNPLVGVAAGTATAAVLKRRGVQVSPIAIPGPAGPLPLRVLRPAGRPRGLIVDLHGGGWVVGSAALNDRLTGHFAEAGMAVASVDYRLLDATAGVLMHDAVADCAAALTWALRDGRDWLGVEHVFVIGESAGAHLAALAALMLRDEGVVSGLAGCVFVQGVFDLSGTEAVRRAGPETLLFDGPNLERDLARLTPDRDEAGRKQADVSPLYGDLSGMPPALFVMGDADPFQDDSRLMAEAWAEGAPAILLAVPTAPHGFQHFGAPTAALAQARIRAWVDRLSGARPLSVDSASR